MGQCHMQMKARSQALIKLAAQILKTWKTPEEIQYPGVRFDSGDPEWRGGYGVARDNELPDFVKKDNDGWDYVAKLKDE